MVALCHGLSLLDIDALRLAREVLEKFRQTPSTHKNKT